MPEVYLTNTEMRAYIAKRDARKAAVIKRIGKCCGRRSGTWCHYLHKICPDMALAGRILSDTRGIR